MFILRALVTIHSASGKEEGKRNGSAGWLSTASSIRTWYSKAATLGMCSTRQQNENPSLVFLLCTGFSYVQFSISYELNS